MTEAFFILVCSVGIVANILILTTLFKFEKGWTLGKKMLLFIHMTELVLLLNHLPPAAAAFATAPTVQPPGLPKLYMPGWGTAECFVPSFIGDFVAVLEPFSLALLAHTRWRVVMNSSKFNQQRGEPPKVGRYIAGLCAGVLLLTIIGHATATGPYVFSVVNLCFRQENWVFIYSFTLSFVLCAPYIGYCYYKVIKTLKSQEGIAKMDQSNKKKREAIRLLIVLAAYYYVSHLVFFINFSEAFLFNPGSFGFLGIEGARTFTNIYLMHSAMSPVLSILLTQRYRVYVLRLLHIVSKGSTLSGSTDGGDGSRSSGSVSATASRSNAHKKLSIASTTASVQPSSGFRHSLGATTPTSYSPPSEGFPRGRRGSFRQVVDVPAGGGFVTPTPRNRQTGSRPFAASASPRSSTTASPRNSSASVTSYNSGFVSPAVNATTPLQSGRPRNASGSTVSGTTPPPQGGSTRTRGYSRPLPATPPTILANAL